MQLVSSTVPHSLGNGAVTKAEAFDRQDLINAFFGIIQEQSDDLSRKIVGFLDPRDANAVRCLNRRVSNIDKLTVESFESAKRFHNKQSEKLYDLLADPAVVIDAHIQRAEHAYKGGDASQRDTQRDALFKCCGSSSGSKYSDVRAADIIIGQPINC